MFGSHQLVQFENLQQGNVSCFASAETNYRITIPIEALPAGEDTLLVFNATFRTNYTNPPVTILPIVGSLICTEEAAANQSNPFTTSVIEIDFETTLSLQDPQRTRLACIYANPYLSRRGTKKPKHCPPGCSFPCFLF